MGLRPTYADKLTQRSGEWIYHLPVITVGSQKGYRRACYERIAQLSSEGVNSHLYAPAIEQFAQRVTEGNATGANDTRQKIGFREVPAGTRSQSPI